MGAQTDLAFQQENAVIPPALRLVRDFVNTVEFQVDDERLGSPDELSAWLAEHGLTESPVPATREHLDIARRLREGLRGVLESHAGHLPDAAAIRRLNDALAELPVRVSFGASESFGLAPATQDPIRGGLGRMLDAVRQASEDGSWVRLKACARPSCRWAYYDHSRNRSGRWCTMAGCGNAVKMQKAYASRKGRPDAAG